MHKCRICGKDQPEELYCKSYLARAYYKCKECQNVYRKAHNRNINTIILNIYNYQKRTASVAYNFKEFSEYLYKQTKFYAYYRIWVEYDYRKSLLPCVLRLDAKKGFSLNNIEIVIKQNSYAKCRKNYAKRVIQMDLKDNIIAFFPSAHVAGKMLGIQYTNINAMCNGRRKSAVPCGGYKWRYA